MRSWLYAGVVTLSLYSCKKDDPAPVTDEERLSGGATTIFSSGADAYSYPLANLDAKGVAEHLIADKLFSQQFVTAPAAKFGGLGPVFNQNSCVSCHTRNGRGSVPTALGDNTTGLLLRLSIDGVNSFGGPLAVPEFGTQLQTKAIYSGTPEGQLAYSEVQEIIKFLDGEVVMLTKPTYSIASSYLPLSIPILTSARQAPAIFGLGLLEAINESDILSQEDISDADGNGISGKANMVWDIIKGRNVLGRFGWKANNPTAHQQAADAAFQDMGLTNSFFREEQCNGQANCNIGLQADLDIHDTIVNMMAFYFQTVAVPAARNITHPEYLAGKKLFTKIGCASCHKPSYTTGIHSITALSNQKIFPYTDLLLHDMGEGLADNRPDFKATGMEWRTPPLWGIGLAQIVNPNAGFLHDGRAKTLEEAILWHGGEAENVKISYTRLTKKEREQLLYFLKSI